MTLKSKKGQGFALDSFTWIVGVIVFVMMAIFIFPIFSEFKDEFVSDPEFNQTNESVTYITDAEEKYPDLMDGIVLTIMVFLAVGIVVSSFLIDSHPIFFVASILILAVFLVIAGMFQEVWTDTFNDPEFNDVKTAFPITNFVMNNLLSFVIGYMSIALISLFAKVFRSDT